MSAIHFGAEGWNARLDEDFTDENVCRVAEAAGLLWDEDHPGAVVYVGYDTRHGAAYHARLVAGVLSACGLTPVLSDRPCPTPALGWNVAVDDGAIGGVMITGNNRSEDYQGIRLRQLDGSAASPEFIERLETLIPQEALEARGDFEVRNIVAPYADELISLVDANAICAAGLHVVVDTMYGAASGIMADILRRLGVKVDEIHASTDGEFFGLHPDPLEPWVDKCEQAVQTFGAACGLVLDGDGDRSALIDENGAYVTPGRLGPLIMKHLARNRGIRGRVVVTLSVSVTNRLMADHLGNELTIVPIGFRNIYEEVSQSSAILALEEYGGVCVPSHLLERDGLLASLYIVEMLAMGTQTVSEHVRELEDEIGNFEYLRRDVRIDAGAIQAFRNMLPGMNPPELAGRVPTDVSHADGLYLRFTDDSWVLARPSRIESVVRVYAESPSARERDALMSAACELAKGEEEL